MFDAKSTSKERHQLLQSILENENDEENVSIFHYLTIFKVVISPNYLLNIYFENIMKV